MPSLRVVGIMSGTSGDGIDVAVTQITPAAASGGAGADDAPGVLGAPPTVDPALRAKAIQPDLTPAPLFLFTSPEKVALSPRFRALLAQLYALRADDGKRLLRLCVVDEAHCVDEHGHSFRPSYRVMGGLRDAFPEVPLLLLTATAPPVSVLSICTSLGVSNPLVLRGELARRQMQYSTVTTSGVKARDEILACWLLQRLRAGERGCELRAASDGLRARGARAPARTIARWRIDRVVGGEQDTAGQERFHALGPIYYRDADGEPGGAPRATVQQ